MSFAIFCSVMIELVLIAFSARSLALGCGPIGSHVALIIINLIGMAFGIAALRGRKP